MENLLKSLEGKKNIKYTVCLNYDDNKELNVTDLNDNNIYTIEENENHTYSLWSYLNNFQCAEYKGEYSENKIRKILYNI